MHTWVFKKSNVAEVLLSKHFLQTLSRKNCENSKNQAKILDFSKITTIVDKTNVTPLQFPLSSHSMLTNERLRQH